jgi:hypothetical protein
MWGPFPKPLLLSTGATDRYRKSSDDIALDTLGNVAVPEDGGWGVTLKEMEERAGRGGLNGKDGYCRARGKRKKPMMGYS